MEAPTTVLEICMEPGTAFEKYVKNRGKLSGKIKQRLAPCSNMTVEKVNILQVKISFVFAAGRPLLNRVKTRYNTQWAHDYQKVE